MIILRQKNYSLRGTRMLAGFNNKILRKSPMISKRNAIKTQDKALTVVANGINKLEKGKNLLNEVALNPGSITNKAVEETFRHPIIMGTNIAGKATMITDPTGIGLIPLGTIGTAGEAALRKYSPRYVKVTDKLANKYHGSKLSRGVEKGINVTAGALMNTARSL